MFLNFCGNPDTHNTRLLRERFEGISYYTVSLHTRSTKTIFLSVKLQICSYPEVLTYVLGAQKKCFIEMVLLSPPQNVFWLRNKKINF